ncbi:MAG: RDD family protein [Chitinophagales bacterium]
MKKIEITTAQKVIIQYELASLRDRIIAFIIDAIILWSTVGILVAIITVSTASNFNPELTETLSWLVATPIVVFYTLVSELITNGQTLGKRMMGLKVVKLNGGLPTADDFLIRWVFRGIDIYTSFGAVAALLVSSSDKAQRLGGLLSNTAVIKLKGDFNIKLEDLEKMFDSANDYEATYPNVTMFTDKDMLVLKELMKRYQSNPNPAHQKLMRRSVISLSRKLNLEEIPTNAMEFLQLVLKDYVMLTR